MLTLDGKTLQYDKAFTHNGVQYPKNWLRLTSLEEKQAIGIVETPDVPVASWDQRFYWGVDNPKDLDQLKETWTSKVKQIAGSMLSQTDWYVVRQAEGGTTVPADVTKRRTEIRTYSNQKEAAIASVTTVEELVSYVTSAAYSAWEEIPEPEPVAESETTTEETTTSETVDFVGGATSSTIATF